MARSLSDVMLSLPDDREMEIGALLETLGSRAHGTAILLLGLPDALPLPVPSVGAVLGLPLIVVSAHLAVFGEEGRLPARVQRWRMPAHGIAVMKRHVVPLLSRLERVSRARWHVVSERQRLLGLVCLALSLVLLLPIPFMNTPPSLCLVLLAWGMIQRDGLFVMTGLAATAALAALLALLARGLVQALT